MRRVINIKILLPLLFSLNAAYSLGAEDWTLVTGTDIKVYEARGGSLEFLSINSLEPAAVLSFRITDTSAKTINFVKYIVSLNDCRKGMGRLIATDPSSQPLYQAHFVFDGGNVASKIAQTICISADLVNQENTQHTKHRLEL